MVKLSVYLVTLNEEQRLEKTLKAAAKVADEIVVVDSGSTDKTEKIAKKFKANFIFHKWKNICKIRLPHEKNLRRRKSSQVFWRLKTRFEAWLAPKKILA